MVPRNSSKIKSNETEKKEKVCDCYRKRNGCFDFFVFRKSVSYSSFCWFLLVYVVGVCSVCACLLGLYRRQRCCCFRNVDAAVYSCHTKQMAVSFNFLDKNSQPACYRFLFNPDMMASGAPFFLLLLFFVHPCVYRTTYLDHNP